MNGRPCATRSAMRQRYSRTRVSIVETLRWSPPAPSTRLALRGTASPTASLGARPRSPHAHTPIAAAIAARLDTIAPIDDEGDFMIELDLATRMALFVFG